MPDSDIPEALPPQDQSEPTGESTSFSPPEPAAELPPTYIGPAVDFGSLGSGEGTEPPIPPEPVVQVYETPVEPDPEPSVEPTFGTPSEPAYESPLPPPPPRVDKSAFEAPPPPPPPSGGGRTWLLYGLGGVFLVCALCVCVMGVAARNVDWEAMAELGEENNGPSVAATSTARSDEDEDSATALPTETEEEPPIEDPEDISVFDVNVGDCFGDPGEDEVASLEAVPCDQPHDNEAYHLADFPAGPDEPFPGEEAIDAFAEESCVTAFEDYVGLSFAESVLQVTYLQPTEGTWEDGDREVVCTLYSNEGPLEGSMRNSER